jgi:hypothetical protein
MYNFASFRCCWSIFASKSSQEIGALAPPKIHLIRIENSLDRAVVKWRGSRVQALSFYPARGFVRALDSPQPISH